CGAVNRDSDNRRAIVLRICETFCSVYFSSPIYCGKAIVFASVLAAADAEAGAEVASFAFGTKFSASFFIIRPPSAEPFTSFKLIPLSFAILRAKGDALTRESSDAPELEVAVDVETSSFSLDSAFSCVDPSDFDALAGALDFCFNSGVTSVPSGPT